MTFVGGRKAGDSIGIPVGRALGTSPASWVTLMCKQAGEPLLQYRERML